EKTLGPDHPALATGLNNRAGLLESQGNFAEADPLYLRAIGIGEKTLGPDLPALGTWLNDRAGIVFEPNEVKRCSRSFQQRMFVRSSRPYSC
ncbi:unnamed protein product, partial [Ectocarpus sp. 8 AP-2014]